MQEFEYAKANCAALAFHKALIGLSQLDALESVSGILSSLYGPRGIYTYYVVYHLFCACMLIVPERYGTKDLKPPANYGKTKEEELNNPSETPEQWENGRKYEADWATNITHTQVKKFCAYLRSENKDQWQTDAPYLIPLYRYFIDDFGAEQHCIPALYEKLCYIRDRILYRPSYVETESGDRIQTSAEIGKELHSLPNVAELYQEISEVYRGFISCMEQERAGVRKMCTHMLSNMWVGRIQEDVDTLCVLGHKKECLMSLGNPESPRNFTFPTYISHLIEFESTSFVQKCAEKYWRPLESLYNENWSAWRKRKRIVR